MFEKDAEIYALSNFGFRGKNSQRVLTAKIDYQAGAEHGYNKAERKWDVNFEKLFAEYVYARSLISDLLRNEEYAKKRATDFIVNDKIDKVDEWHYPSKGEYPDDKTEMLIYFKYTDCEYPCKTFGFYNGHFWDTKRGDVSNKEVIAWKEIVFPEE